MCRCSRATHDFDVPLGTIVVAARAGRPATPRIISQQAKVTSKRSIGIQIQPVPGPARRPPICGFRPGRRRLENETAAIHRQGRDEVLPVSRSRVHPFRQM